MQAYSPLDASTWKAPRRRAVAAAAVIFAFAALGTALAIYFLGSDQLSVTLPAQVRAQEVHARLTKAIAASPESIELDSSLAGDEAVSKVFSVALGASSLMLNKPVVQLTSTGVHPRVTVSGVAVMVNVAVVTDIHLTFALDGTASVESHATLVDEQVDAVKLGVQPEVHATKVGLHISTEGALLVTCELQCPVAKQGETVTAAGLYGSPLRFPLPDITIGKVKLTNIDATIQKSPDAFAMTATATLLFADAQGRDLVFAVSGTVGKTVLQFSGTQTGQWSANQDLVLSNLAIAYDSTAKTGHIQGEVQFGAWGLELVYDYVAASGNAFALVPSYTSKTAMSLSGLPGAASFTGASLVSVKDAAVVIADYAGSLTIFADGTAVSFIKGVTVCAVTTIDGATVTLSGQYATDRSWKLEGDFSNLQLGKDLTLANSKMLVQHPAQPPVQVSSTLTWGSLTIDLLGTLSATDIVFHAATEGTVWRVPVGKNGIVVQNVVIDVDYSRATKATTSEVSGQLQLSSSLALNVDMKYPADAADAGCYALSVATSSEVSVSHALEALLSKTGIASDYVADAGELFAASLEQMAFTLWPNCGYAQLQGTIATKLFGNSQATVTVQRYATVSNVFASLGSTLSVNPQVLVATDVSVAAKDVLAALATATATASVSDPVVFPVSHLVDSTVTSLLSQLQSSVATTVQVSFPNGVEVDAAHVLTALSQALASQGSLVVSSHMDGDWHFEFHVQPVSQTYPINSPGGVHLTAPSFALTSASMALTLDITFISKTGLNFNARLDITQSSGDVQHLSHYVLCSQTAFTIAGAISKASGWSFSFGVPAGCIELDKDRFEVSAASITVQSASPQVSVASTITLKKMQNVAFVTQATVQVGKGFTASGVSDGTLLVHILGKNPILVDSLSLSLSDSSGQWDVDVDGKATLHDNAQVDVSVEVDDADGFVLKGSLAEPQSMSDMVDSLIGRDSFDSGIPMPSHVHDSVLGAKLLGGDLLIQTIPPTFKIDGKVGIFGQELDCMLSYIDSKFAFGISFATNPNFHFSDIFPDIHDMDSLKTSSPAIVIANAEQEMHFPGGDISYSAANGLNFVAGWVVDPSDARQSRMSSLIKQEDELLLQGIIKSPTDFRIAADVELAVQLFHRASMVEAGVFFALDGGDLKVGIHGGLSLSIGTTSDELTFYGDLFFDTEGGAGFDAGMATPWVHPFHIPGLTLDACEVSLTLSPALVPTEFGIAGGLQVGSVGGDAMVFADVADIAKSALAASVENINLGNLVDDVLHGIIPDALTHTIFDVSLKGADISINPTGEPLVFDGHTYPVGFVLDVDQLNMWDIIKGSAHIDIDPLHALVSVSGDMDPVNLGDVLEVSEVKLDIALGATDNKVGFSGAVSLLGASMATDVELSDADTHAYVKFALGDLLNFLMNCSAVGDLHHPSDFSVLAELNDELLDWVSDKIPQYALDAKEEADSEFEKVKADLDQKQADLDSISQQIDAIKAEDQRELTEDEQKCIDAKADLERAKAKVDGLQNSIDSEENALHSCSRWNLFCKGYHAAKIAALWVEKHVADAALDVAIDVVNAAEAVLEKIPDVDPRVLALEAERGLAEAALKLAEIAVDAAESLTNMIDNVIAWVAKEAGRVLNIEHALLSGSLAAIKSGDLAHVELEGYFIGQHVNLSLDINLALLDNFAEDIWHLLRKLF